MKTRIKIDSSILSVVIIFTGVFYIFPQTYIQNLLVDNILDFIGMASLLKGTLLRMAARGHKKFHSSHGNALVITGPYTVVRNPMYLGSFMMGAGFLMIVWPWWTLPVFALLFYLRFNPQMVKEETYLKGQFGETFAEYSAKVPRVFPKLTCRGIRLKEIFNPQEAFSTKEKNGLLWWPILAIVLETLQQGIVLGNVDLIGTVMIFTAAAVVLLPGGYIFYKKEQ